ncbi:MAG: AsmA family protein [bacterium]|nr:AsmA family protein [bacterium]
MKAIKRFLVRVVVFIFVIAVVLVVARNHILPPVIAAGVKAATGLGVRIGSMDIGLGSTYVDIQQLRLLNPPGFVDPVMVEAPQIKVDYDLRALLRKKLHLHSVVFALEEVLIVRNADGRLNLEALKALRERGQPPAEPRREGKKMALEIDELTVRIGKITIKDYTGGGAPRVQEIVLNVDERFTDITDVNELTVALVMKIVTRAGVAGILNLDVRGLASLGLTEAAKAAGGLLGGAVTNVGKEPVEAVRDAADALKKVLPFRR